MFKKGFKYFLLTLLIVVGLLVAGGFYFLYTNSGLKNAIALVNRFSAYTIQAESIEGSFLGNSVLNKLHVRGKHFDFSSESVVLDWQSKALWKGALVIRSIAIADASVMLIPPQEKQPKPAEQVVDLEDIDLPIDIHLEELLITNLVIKNPVNADSTINERGEQQPVEEGDLVIDKIQLGIDYQGQKAVVHTFAFEGLEALLNLTGEITTKGQFPLQLRSTGNYNYSRHNQAIVTRIDGALKDTLTMKMQGQGITEFELDATLAELFEAPELTASLSLKKIDDKALGLTDTRMSGTTEIRAKLGDTVHFSHRGEIDFDSPQTDALKFVINSEFDGERIQLNTLTLDLLTAKQQLTGRGHYTIADRNLDVLFHSDQLRWPQTGAQPDFVFKDSEIKLTGSLDNYAINVKTAGKTHAIGDIDLLMTGNGNAQSIDDLSAQLLLNQQPATLEGKIHWAPALAYEFDVKADEITPFNRLPEIKGLTARISGDEKNYAAKGKLHLSRDDIPPADVDFSVSGNSKTLETAQLNIATLNGKIVATANGQLEPLNLAAMLETQGIKPQTFYPDFSADINSRIVLAAKRDQGKLAALATIDSLSGTLQNQPLSGSGTINYNQARNHIDFQQLSLNLGGNKVDANGLFALTDKSSVSNLTATVDAPQLGSFLPKLSGAINADILAKGSLISPDFDVDLQAKNLSYQDQQIDQLRAQINAHTNTVSRDLNTRATVFYDAPTTGPLQLTAIGNYDNRSRLSLSAVTLDLLDTQQQIIGSGYFDTDSQALAVTVTGEALSWPQTTAQPDIHLTKTQLDVSGKLSDYQLQGQTHLTLPTVGKMAVALSGNGDLDGIDKIASTVTVNDEPVAINGALHWLPELDYQLTVGADKFSLKSPQTHISQLDLKAVGNAEGYQVNGGAKVNSDTIPPSTIDLNLSGSPTRLENAQMAVKTLGGDIHIKARGNLSPLDVTATIAAREIQPQQFYPGVDANISTTLSAAASQNGGKLTAVADIEKLTGTLQKQALSGSGKIKYDQLGNQVAVSGLAINLGGNKLTADGTLGLEKSVNQSGLVAKLDAANLKSLHSDLDGALTGDIRVTGSMAEPNINANLSGNTLTYQDMQAKQVSAKAKLNLKTQDMAINAAFDTVKIGENDIDSATLEATGKIDNHQLSASVKAPKNAVIPTTKLAASGGLNREKMVWRGTLKQLTLDNQTLGGAWQLKQPSAIQLSAAETRLSSLCLAQKKSALCADGKLSGGNGQFTLDLQSLSTKPLEPFMPRAFSLHSALSGKTRINVKNGNVNVEGKLSADGGHVNIHAGQGGMKANIKQLDSAFSLKNNRLEAIVKSNLSKLGKIDIAARMPDINRGKIDASLKIDNQSLTFVEEIVPQLAGVSGKLTGDISVSGVPQKSLNVAGKITLHNTDFNVPQFGSEIRGLTLDIFAKNGNKIGFAGTAKGGDGDFTIDGEIDPNTQKGNINIKGEAFQAANSNDLKVTISPDIQVLFSDRIQVRGTVTVPKALIVPDLSSAKITVSEDVILPHQEATKQSPSSPVDVEVLVKLGDNVRVASADIETRLDGEIKIIAKPGAALKAVGAIEVETGELRVYGQMLNIERGRIIFSNGPIANPSLDIRTSRYIDDEDITVGANVLGNVEKPEISLFSTPSMAESSILSYLLFGRPPNGNAFGMTALLQTGGMVGANAMSRGIRSSLGLDVLDFDLTGVEAGKNLNKKIYVGLRSRFFDALNQLLLDYKISARTRVESVISAEEMSIDLIKVIESD